MQENNVTAVLAGLQEVSNGAVFFEEKYHVRKTCRRNCGMVFQSLALSHIST